MKKLLIKMIARSKLVKAFRTAEIYKTYSTDNGDRYILPKIHYVSITDQSTQYVFTLPTGVNPDLLKKNFFVFEQIFGRSIKLEGEIKKFVLTEFKGKLPKELIYNYNAVTHAIEGLQMPI